ncbi:hypothetical protein [Prosthecobacter dejongeii]|uniref:Uncharacterized protein n=1 Tax=Prosthecobacter dejongeii TaxID=48465 RepID=A0A7W7YQF6_9BACT|nr:hypothetical protein [Prosthecobacter dejongeii]MBB5040451.1 hypothetical protein [Prosthecobacter dejongeii]
MSVKYQCTHCDFTQRVRQEARVYEKEEPKCLRPICWLAWCHTCKKVVDAERVPTLRELEDHLESVRLEPYAERKLFAYWPPDEEIIVTQRYIEWRKNRVAPSRCFECGGHDVLFSTASYGDLPCPQCSGGMEAHITLIGGSFTRFAAAVYSLEGELITPGNAPEEWLMEF